MRRKSITDRDIGPKQTLLIFVRRQNQLVDQPFTVIKVRTF